MCPKISVTLMAFRHQIRYEVSLRTKEAKSEFWLSRQLSLRALEGLPHPAQRFPSCKSLTTSNFIRWVLDYFSVVSVDSLSSFASQSCHRPKSDTFTQTVYLFVTYHCSCNGCNFEQFFISVSKMHAQFQGCWHKKARTLWMRGYY